MVDVRSSHARRSVRVLVVDDNEDHRLLIGRRLEEEGVEVKTASSGGDALEQLEGVDLVLLDYLLPDMSGLDTLRAIRERQGPSVVLVTGMGSESVAVTAMREGAIDYIVKDSSYLTMIPEIVDRAWRHHDLSRRAGRLQSLALLVSEAEDPGEVLREILHGAKELLDATDCVVVLFDKDDVSVVGTSGAMSDYPPSLVDRARKVMESGVSTPSNDDFLVPLTRGRGESLGVLVITSEPDKPVADQDVELAETFAAFAATALRRSRQRELERSLITQLQDTLEMRRDFVNSVSHELRTPLACISGFSSTLLTFWGKLDSDTTKSSIEKIQAHSEDLARLVEGLLDFGKVEKGTFSSVPKEVSLPEAVEEVVGGMKPLLGKREVKVAVPELVVSADPDLLKRILMNLLSNAAKATESDGAIGISAEQVDGSARVDVVDDGRGLSEEEIERVFEPFWRSKVSVKEAQRGAGLGLTLVQEYVHEMGGEVHVTSVMGEGAKFSFTLPLAAGS
ncbi:MAG: two-component system, OmpR family, phosphate regulon sensor histidine kinase PhoR [Actinomycetota bacterium]|jgi:signal transduction histidine kinase/FixJ family two-component response regulator|nr:two-component system, OmpR family, phosphate regulon sensor histidine kinase PhoR [Actinomycetota bacterium]